MKSTMSPIGFVVATVRVPIFADDALGENNKLGDWFEYAEPGITNHGSLGVCRREAKIIEQRYESGEHDASGHNEKQGAA